MQIYFGASKLCFVTIFIANKL